MWPSRTPIGLRGNSTWSENLGGLEEAGCSIWYGSHAPGEVSRSHLDLDVKIDRTDWDRLRRLAGRTFASSLHFSLATTNGDGSPRVTPIGSLILTDPGEGYYFEIFTDGSRQNLERGSAVAVLGVISSRTLWIASLARGSFRSPPAFRLNGVAGVRRASTQEERARFERKVRRVRWLKGYELLWGDLSTVRELHFRSLEPVHLGKLTPAGLWDAVSGTGPADAI